MRYSRLLTTVAIFTASSALAQSGAPVPLDVQLQYLEQQRQLQAEPTQTAPTPMPRKTFPEAAPVRPTGTSTTATPVMSSGGMPVSTRTGEVINSVGGGAIAALPLQLITENGISYISGGIGEEETAQLDAQEASFNVQIWITNMDGGFVSNVNFTLKDASGKTLVTVPDAGPKVYLSVPEGDYTVEAAGLGTSQSVKVKASAKTFKHQIRL